MKKASLSLCALFLLCQLLPNIVSVQSALAYQGGDCPGSNCGFTFSRAGAIRYAHKWEYDRNPNYDSYGNNCTNFVSQIWHEGGTVPLDHYYPYWTGDYTSWTVATDFRNYWYLNR